MRMERVSYGQMSSVAKQREQTLRELREIFHRGLGRKLVNVFFFSPPPPFFVFDFVWCFFCLCVFFCFFFCILKVVCCWGVLLGCLFVLKSKGLLVVILFFFCFGLCFCFSMFVGVFFCV